MRALSLLAASLLLACAPPSDCPHPYDPATMAEPDDPAFLGFVDAHLSAMGAPGAGLALLRDGALVWTGGVGFADTVTREEVDEDTLFMLASVSKLFTGASVAQALDEGLLDLDEDVNALLPFALTHPDAPELSITPRLLLTHRSGIRDEDSEIWSNYVRGDSSEALGDYLRSYLEPGGARYDAQKNFGPPPGEDYRYSNIGYALLGWLVELAAAEPFDAYSRRRLLDPMGLDSAGWFLRDVDEDRVAHPHMQALGAYWRGAHYGYPDYPDGQLRLTAADMARFLISYHPRFGEESVVSRRVAEVFWEERLGWKTYSWGEETAFGHGGSDRGVQAQVRIGEDSGDGFVLLVNAKVSSALQEAHRDCLVAGLKRVARGGER